jgi:hypothetical protein
MASRRIPQLIRTHDAKIPKPAVRVVADPESERISATRVEEIDRQGGWGLIVDENPSLAPVDFNHQADPMLWLRRRSDRCFALAWKPQAQQFPIVVRQRHVLQNTRPASRVGCLEIEWPNIDDVAALSIRACVECKLHEAFENGNASMTA